MKKKYALLVLISLLVTGFASGCGTGSKTSLSSSVSDSAVAEVTTENVTSAVTSETPTTEKGTHFRTATSTETRPPVVISQATTETPTSAPATENITSEATTETPATSATSAESGYYEGYYSSISTSLTGGMNGTLRTALTSLIQPKAYFNYSGDASGCLGLILQDADEDPENPDNMVLFYTQESVSKRPSASAANWNREHCWPQSNSGGLYGTSGGGADLLHIRPTYATPNSTRGNYIYGIVKDHSSPLTYNGMNYGYKGVNAAGNTVFEPLDVIKGDVARITLYMWVTYFASRGTAITNNAESIETMVKWANEDEPSAIELNRNDYAEASKQKNRNPFVDHPEWVNTIFAA